MLSPDTTFPDCACPVGQRRGHTSAYIYAHQRCTCARARARAPTQTHTPLQLTLHLLQAQKHLLPKDGAARKATFAQRTLAFSNLSNIPPIFQGALLPGTHVLQGSLPAGSTTLFLSLKHNDFMIPFGVAPVPRSARPIPQGWSPGLPSLSHSQETSPPHHAE